jgi:hypothetical protein
MTKICGVIDTFDCSLCAFWSKLRKCLVECNNNEFEELLKYKKIIILNNENYEQYKNVVIQFGKKKNILEYTKRKI